MRPTDSDRDTLFARPGQGEKFRFDASVARVFPDMIRRSVPGYTTIIPMIEVITRRFARPDTLCYDLGCSLGAATLAMRHGIQTRGTRIVAVDNSAAMIERCEHHIALDDSAVPVELRCADLLDMTFEPASVATLNFTLQFIAPEQRLPVLERLRHALSPGGVLILSEKIALPDPSEQDLLAELHHDFKRANGYSDLEISQKRSALEEVLIPETLDTHRSRLKDAGFTRVHLWYQCFNFMSLIAIAPESDPQ